MKNRTASVALMHARDKWTWLYIPWMVLLSSFIVNFAIGLIARPDNFTTGGLLSILIYMLVAGMIVIHQTFSFALGLCITRRSYFAGTAAAAVGFILLSAVLLTVMLLLERATGAWGVGLHFFEIPYLSDSGAGLALWTFFSLLLFMFFGGLATGSLFRRFGKKGLFSFFLLCMLGFGGWTAVVTAKNWWRGVGSWLMKLDFTIVQTTFLLLACALALAAISYMLLRRSTVQT
ncbi:MULTISPECIES: hypothetical protein [unclassified Paenibacillus]|uniref:hypothetical protein n=1 Tax=unclassified Paenibacillus TaxID=185978 RepID=UPI000953A1BB|nr:MULTISPECIES: hypothetical protein [unclassified Paenibacillus]ASS67709.1 hypothetical protein CIC07_17300 [Paenibacillus sp. RUD330]SIR67176.1 hypothetical protein SAMN05880555_4673 [Paenibacillus sp. RU4X]SIR74989.1 hypothetical protein SAMN05880570_4675 [Paenibacillus sp. RU4T]